MQNVIPLYRPPIWRRLAIGAAILVVLGIFAGAAYAGEPAQPTARPLC